MITEIKVYRIKCDVCDYHQDVKSFTKPSAEKYGFTSGMTGNFRNVQKVLCHSCSKTHEISNGLIIKFGELND